MGYSFGILKPDCLKRGIEEEAISLIECSGLRVISFKRVRLTREDVGAIWPSCREMEFYGDMVDLFLSGDCIVFLVEGEDAIKQLNDVVGHFDPEKAEVGTIRRLLGTSPMENVIHSSLDEEAYEKEKSLFLTWSFEKSIRHEPRAFFVLYSQESRN